MIKTSEKTTLKNILILCSVMLFCSVITASAADIFDISYSLTEGGFRVEFNQVNPAKGIKINVTSNVATRYEIELALVRPLENRDKPNVTIRDNFVVRGIRGTNQFGDFRLPSNDAPVRTSQAIYVSNTTGSADSITLVLSVNDITTLQAGYYTGQLSVTLKPIGSSRPYVVKYIDISATVPQAQTKDENKSIQFSTVSGNKRIALNPKKTETQSGDILVTISGTFSQQFKIVQTILQPLESKEGNSLGYEAVKFAIKEATMGTAESLEKNLSSGRQILYSSLPDGKADKTFIITYSLNDLTKQTAGNYTTKIQFSLEEMGNLTNLDTFTLELENERAFDLTIAPEDQLGSLEFRNLKPNQPAKPREVTLTIKSNIGKRYQVNQKLFTLLTSREGQIVPEANFTLKTESLSTKGSLRYLQPQAIKEGEMTLLLSDAEGSPDSFKIIYELNFPKELKAGNYSTRITYSLSEI
ncbi:MAG: hypothetical protein WDL87_05415 [Candidatus Omnitrophota bacterium]|jgi:hypothetical protein